MTKVKLNKLLLCLLRKKIWERESTDILSDYAGGNIEIDKFYDMYEIEYYSNITASRDIIYHTTFNPQKIEVNNTITGGSGVLDGFGAGNPPVGGDGMLLRRLVSESVINNKPHLTFGKVYYCNVHGNQTWAEKAAQNSCIPLRIYGIGKSREI